MDDMDRETEIEWHRRKYSGHIHRADDPGYYHHRHCRPAELTTTIPVRGAEQHTTQEADK